MTHATAAPSTSQASERPAQLSGTVRCALFLAVMAFMALEPGAPPALRWLVPLGAAYVIASSHPRLVRRPEELKAALLTLDVLLVSALVYVSGGLGSAYYPLYYLPVLIASIRMHLRDAVAAAILVGLSYYFVGMATGERLVIDGSRHVLVFAGGALFMAVFFSLLVRETNAYQRLSESYRRESEHKSDFVAYVAHEFRNSLAAVIGFALLLEEKPDDPAGGEYVGIIRSEAERLNRMISDLLDLSLLEAGRMRLHLAGVALEGLLRDEVVIFNERWSNHRVELRLGEELPATIYASRDRLQQVLQNLIGNAIKFSPEGTPVLVEAAREGAGKVAIAVTDYGPGIPPDQVARMFERFERLQRDDDKPGTGLGLAITRGLVELHGGSITVNSRPGFTTFRVLLPIAGQAGQQLSPAPRWEAPPALPQRTQ